MYFCIPLARTPCIYQSLPVSDDRRNTVFMRHLVLVILRAGLSGMPNSHPQLFLLMMGT